MNVVSWIRLPLVPNTWKLKVPAFAEAATLMDIVELPGAIGFGEKTTWTPEGTPIACGKTHGRGKAANRAYNDGCNVDSRWMSMLDGLTVIVKSCGEDT